MKIKFYAHACFGFEHDGFRIVTDPYQPGEKASKFDPVNEPADLVIMSSTSDPFHCDPSHVLGHPEVVNALEIPPEGRRVQGLDIRAYKSRERFQWHLLRYFILPGPFALYSFELGGVRVLHTGDLGRPLKARHVEALRGNVDVMLAVAGAVHNIEHRDLLALIEAIQPRVVIPMHYYSPKGVLKNLPVEAFTAHFDASQVDHIDSSEIEFAPDTLPDRQRVVVLEQCR